MNTTITTEQFKRYFKLSELVCPHVLKKYKEEQCWSFFDPRLLKTLIEIRLIVGKPMVINNGTFTQRGLRCNQCDEVKKKTIAGQVYMSSHIRGTAVDFHVQGMTPKETRELIIRHQDKLTHPIRMEKDVNWVHIDVDNMSTQQIYMFGV